jgi:hypothetical protein
MTDVDKNPRSLDQRLESLPRELPPARDLWPDIAARIGDLKPRRRGAMPASRGGFRIAWRPFAAAAAVALVAVLGIHVYFGDGELRQDSSQQVALAPEALSTFGPGHALGSGYQAARAGLADDLELRLEALPPETRATVLENLETIRRAVAEINAALGDDPSNILLQHQLLAAYQDELAVLAHLNRVTERLPPRNEI